MVGLYSCILYLFTSVIYRVLFMFKPNYQNRPAFHKFVIISTLYRLREFYTEIDKKFWNMPIVRKFFDQSLFVFIVFSFYRLKLSSQIRVRILLYTISGSFAQEQLLLARVSVGCTGALALVLGFFLNAFSESVPLRSCEQAKTWDVTRTRTI